jgi:hypothetical protein
MSIISILGNKNALLILVAVIIITFGLWIVAGMIGLTLITVGIAIFAPNIIFGVVIGIGGLLILSGFVKLPGNARWFVGALLLVIAYVLWVGI